jgi:hypothetical protein
MEIQVQVFLYFALSIGEDLATQDPERSCMADKQTSLCRQQSSVLTVARPNLGHHAIAIHTYI